MLQDTPNFPDDAARSAAALLSSASALGIAAVFVIRIGTGEPVFAIAALLVAGILPMVACAAVLSRDYSSAPRRNTIAAAVTLVAILLPCFAILSAAAAAIGTAALLLGSITALASRRVLHTPVAPVRFASTAALFALMLVASSGQYRLFLPEELALGASSGDGMFHAALAQMIANHRAISLGADGLIYQPYHFLSHAVAAGLANMTGAKVPLVYVYWGAVILKAQLVFVFAISSLLVETDRAASSASIAVRLVLGGLLIVFSGATESESFLLGLSLFLILLPVLFECARTRIYLPGASLALAGAFLCAAAKISIGFYVAVILLGIVWRTRRRVAVAATLLIGLVPLVLVTQRYLTPLDTLGTNWQVLARSYLQYLNVVAIVSFAAPAILLWIYIQQPRLAHIVTQDSSQWQFSFPRTATKKSAIDRLRWFLNDSPPQVLIVGLSLAASVLVMLTVPIGSNLGYFSLTLLFIAMTLAPPVLSTTGIDLNATPARRLLWSVVAITAAILTVQFAWNAKNSVFAMYRANFPESANQSVTKEVLKLARDSRSLLDPIRNRGEQTPWAQLTRDIAAQSASGGPLVVHTAPAVTDYWQRLKSQNPYWCLTPHLMIPSQIGIVQIRNIAPESIEQQCMPEGLVFYGFGNQQSLHRTGGLPRSQLCEIAKRSGFDRLYLIESVSDPKLNSVVNCSNIPAG